MLVCSLTLKLYELNTRGSIRLSVSSFSTSHAVSIVGVAPVMGSTIYVWRAGEVDEGNRLPYFMHHYYIYLTI